MIVIKFIRCNQNILSAITVAYYFNCFSGLMLLPVSNPTGIFFK